MTPETIEPECGSEPDPDPATPARRLELARTMLVWAIHQYEQASHQWSVVQASFPRLPAPAPWPRDMDEHRGWLRLLHEADESFNAAELVLAQRIENLFDALARPGHRTSDLDTPYFVPRAVRHQGSIYVLAYGVADYEPKSNAVAVYREAMTLDLDAAPPGRVTADVE